MGIGLNADYTLPVELNRKRRSTAKPPGQPDRSERSCALPAKWLLRGHKDRLHALARSTARFRRANNTSRSAAGMTGSERWILPLQPDLVAQAPEPVADTEVRAGWEYR